MDAELTAKAIAKLLGLTKRAVLVRAKREEWQFKEVQNSSGGGLQRVFVFQSLPDDLKMKIISAHSECSTNITVPRNCPLDKAKSIVFKWDKAPKKYRQRAEARADILKAIDAFCMEKGLKQTRGEEFFVQLYRDKAAPHKIGRAHV